MLRTKVLVLLLVWTTFAQSDIRVGVWHVVTVGAGIRELDGSYPVPPTGVIMMPVVGDLVVLGKTPKEIGAAVTERLSTKGLADSPPRIEIQWLVAITGYVNRPGGYSVSRGATVGELLELAQGTVMGVSHDISIVRLNDQILERVRGASRRDVLQPGDVVVVGPWRENR